MSKVVKRQVEREVYVPFEDGDTELVELVKTVYQKTIECDEVKGQIGALKEKLKAPQEELNEAVDTIARGKPVLTACVEILDYDAGTVVVKRQDTGKVILQREMEDADYQAQIGDEDADGENEDGEGEDE